MTRAEYDRALWTLWAWWSLPVTWTPTAAVVRCALRRPAYNLEG
jgi:hypothetical protein